MTVVKQTSQKGREKKKRGKKLETKDVLYEENSKIEAKTNLC